MSGSFLKRALKAKSWSESSRTRTRETPFSRHSLQEGSSHRRELRGSTDGLSARGRGSSREWCLVLLSHRVGFCFLAQCMQGGYAGPHGPCRCKQPPLRTTLLMHPLSLCTAHILSSHLASGDGARRGVLGSTPYAQAELPDVG